MPILTTAPLGLADMEPIGRLIAGATETSCVDEGFDKCYLMPISGLPILVQLLEAQRQEM